MKLFDLVKFDILRTEELIGSKHSRINLRLCLKIFSPRYLPTLLYRISYSVYSLKIPLLPKIISFVNFLIFGIEISPRIEIGPGLFFPHTQGTVVGAKKIGKNATIYQQVTLGAKELDMNFNFHLRPEIGDNVTIGAGAKILGDIKVDDNAVIGANSVVIDNVPSNCIFAGIPAKMIKKKG